MTVKRLSVRALKTLAGAALITTGLFLGNGATAKPAHAAGEMFTVQVRLESVILTEIDDAPFGANVAEVYGSFAASTGAPGGGHGGKGVRNLGLWGNTDPSCPSNGLDF